MSLLETKENFSKTVIDLSTSQEVLIVYYPIMINKYDLQEQWRY